MLEGIRIVEIEGLGPGPFAAMLLADLGADVVVVHRKGGSTTPGMPAQAILDRGKRSIELNLKDADDIATLKRLLVKADGLIEGFRPGVMEKLGLGPEDCLAVNPGLVFGRMTGWGQDGPLARASGHDFNYISLSGAAWYAGNVGEPPFPPPSLVGDVGGGAMYLAVGMLAGILNARATGQGTAVDAAIYDGSAHMMNLMMTLRQTGNWQTQRGHSMLDGPHWSRSYRTADGGFVSVQCLEPKFYTLFLGLLGLAEDADFQAQFDRAMWAVLSDRLSAIFMSKARDEWALVFLGTDACVAPILNPDEALAHPLNTARQTWQKVDGALQAAPAPRFSTEPAWAPAAIPVRGQHTDEILAELAAT